MLRAAAGRRSQVGVREAQSLGRIPETLTVAMEFITMPCLQEQLPALEELRKQIVRCACCTDRASHPPPSRGGW